MSVVIVFQQMLVLFGMIAMGYIAYKKKLIEERGIKSISAVIVTILNPFLVISSVLNKKIEFSGEVIKQNAVMVAALYLILIVVSIIFAKAARLSKEDSGSYCLMMTFPNLGFMGIPLVSNIYGPEAVILVAFYMLGYNLLVYSYGIYVANTERDGGSAGVPIRKMMNPGMLSCIIAILIFAFDIHLPVPAESFADYVGNAAIPLSMMMVGVGLAKIKLRTALTDMKLLAMVVVKLLLVPIAAILLLKNSGVDKTVFGVFGLLLSTPVGSIVTLVEMEYGREDNSLCAKGIALTTLLSMVTIPIATFFVS